LRWRCKLGHVWRALPIYIGKGVWCPECSRARQFVHTIEEMRAIAHDRGGRCLSDAYVDLKTRLKWECARGHAWSTSPMSVLIGSWCPRCARAKQRIHTIEEMHAIAHDRGGRCLSDTYVSINKKLEWECARGHAWSSLTRSVLAGHWCPQCAYLDRCTTDKPRRKYLAVKHL
jgi:hypothetical protein